MKMADAMPTLYSTCSNILIASHARTHFKMILFVKYESTLESIMVCMARTTVVTTSAVTACTFVLALTLRRSRSLLGNLSSFDRESTKISPRKYHLCALWDHLLYIFCPIRYQIFPFYPRLPRALAEMSNK